MRCKVCGKRFTPTKETTYIASESTQDGLLSPLRITYMDCVDCPFCGRQHMLGIRMPELSKNSRKENDKCR